MQTRTSALSSGVLRNICHGLDVNRDNVHLQVLNFRAVSNHKKRLIVSDGMFKTEHAVMSNQLCELIHIHCVFKVTAYKTIPYKGSKCLFVIESIEEIRPYLTRIGNPTHLYIDENTTTTTTLPNNESSISENGPTTTSTPVKNFEMEGQKTFHDNSKDSTNVSQRILSEPEEINRYNSTFLSNSAFFKIF